MLNSVTQFKEMLGDLGAITVVIFLIITASGCAETQYLVNPSACHTINGQLQCPKHAVSELN